MWKCMSIAPRSTRAPSVSRLTCPIVGLASKEKGSEQVEERRQTAEARTTSGYHRAYSASSLALLSRALRQNYVFSKLYRYNW